MAVTLIDPAYKQYYYINDGTISSWKYSQEAVRQMLMLQQYTINAAQFTSAGLETLTSPDDRSDQEYTLDTLFGGLPAKINPSVIKPFTCHNYLYGMMDTMINDMNAGQYLIGLNTPALNQCLFTSHKQEIAKINLMNAVLTDNLLTQS